MFSGGVSKGYSVYAANLQSFHAQHCHCVIRIYWRKIRSRAISYYALQHACLRIGMRSNTYAVEVQTLISLLRNLFGPTYRAFFQGLLTSRALLLTSTIDTIGIPWT